MLLSIRHKRDGGGQGIWGESFGRQRQTEKHKLQRPGKVSRKVAKIPGKIKSVQIKKRTEPLNAGCKIKRGHVNTQNLWWSEGRWGKRNGKPGRERARWGWRVSSFPPFSCQYPTTWMGGCSEPKSHNRRQTCAYQAWGDAGQVQRTHGTA